MVSVATECVIQTPDMELLTFSALESKHGKRSPAQCADPHGAQPRRIRINHLKSGSVSSLPACPGFPKSPCPSGRNWLIGCAPSHISAGYRDYFLCLSSICGEQGINPSELIPIELSGGWMHTNSYTSLPT